MSGTYRVIAAVSLAMVAAACSTVSAPPKELPKESVRDTLIVPHVRLGAATLWMTEAQMLQWLGEPQGSESGLADGGLAPRPHQYIYDNANGALSLHLTKGRVYSVGTSDSRYATAQGIRVGSTELKTRVTYGEPVKQRVIRNCGDANCSTLVPVEVWMCFRNDLEVRKDVKTDKITYVAVHGKACSL